MCLPIPPPGQRIKSDGDTICSFGFCLRTRRTLTDSSHTSTLNFAFLIQSIKYHSKSVNSRHFDVFCSTISDKYFVILRYF
ncbi:hypothetical protein [Vibrio gallaecicus]|uniref:hypothetical protein n=1 Tax=Vibrio gallaecicus TaxID=552386 RepID=UPI0025B2A239|nr:hypothetical protein [Vibrio gallaecicus]MDN3617149.1 hypothetical protein [Vibrio gallaecicus]